MAHSLANQGSLQQQPNKPVTLAHVANILRRKTATLWETATGSNDDRTQKFSESRQDGDYIEVLNRYDAVQLFRVHSGYSLLRSDMFRRKWSRLCGDQNEDCFHVLFSCGELSGVRGSDWSDSTLQEALWGSKENKFALNCAALMLRVFKGAALLQDCVSGNRTREPQIQNATSHVVTLHLSSSPPLTPAPAVVETRPSPG
ncbi:hypothetical protein PoB_000934500 [Plakobranchus ocellatus]|uniref:Uncharacterized protein n=1 Tax=Plakobranchus ocellatus TaxID=259542 RepID=A0AAV3YK17_9GAST|nr:hypothetical protein PoB_000934500 [Plakobranchus ocellatus]